MKLSKIVNSCLSSLQTAYENGIIPYPRVDNDFIRNSSFDLFPHPSFKPALNLLKPLEFTSFTLNKETSLLFLSANGFARPSEFSDTAALIDDFFDDELNFQSEELKKQAEQAEEIMANVLAEMNLSDSKLMKAYRESFADDVYDAEGSGFVFFETDEVYFSPAPTYFGEPKPSPLASYTKWEIERQERANNAKKKNPDETTQKKGSVPKFKSLDDGIAYFREAWAVRQRYIMAIAAMSAQAAEIQDGLNAIKEQIADPKAG